MCLTVFFFPYAAFEVPSNIALKLLRPNIWLTILIVLWGTVLTTMTVVKNYEGLLAARIFLGVTEVGSKFLVEISVNVSVGWFLSCGYIPSYLLVLQTRIAIETSHLFLRGVNGRRIFWIAGICYCQNGRCRKFGRVAMVSDLYLWK